MKRVLIVDDDEAILDSLEMALELDYQVVTASTADRALAAAAGAAFDVILLDLMMPDLDGVSLKQRLDELGVDAPVLLITASMQGENKAREAGAAGYLAKPFKYAALAAEIERVTS